MKETDEGDTVDSATDAADHYMMSRMGRVIGNGNVTDKAMKPDLRETHGMTCRAEGEQSSGPMLTKSNVSLRQTQSDKRRRDGLWRRCVQRAVVSDGVKGIEGWRRRKGEVRRQRRKWETRAENKGGAEPD